MPRRFPSQRLADGDLAGLVGSAYAELRAERHLVVAPQAHLEPAVGSDAGAVAAVAEVLGHGPDEADVAHRAARVAPAQVVGRSPATLVARLEEDALLAQQLLHARGRQGPPGAEGHDLDEPRRGPALPGVAHE